MIPFAILWLFFSHAYRIEYWFLIWSWLCVPQNSYILHPAIITCWRPWFDWLPLLCYIKYIIYSFSLSLSFWIITACLVIKNRNQCLFCPGDGGKSRVFLFFFFNISTVKQVKKPFIKNNSWQVTCNFLKYNLSAVLFVHSF